MTGHPRTSLLPPSLPPRGLSRLQASEYIGVSPSKFDEMVRDGRMPKPKRVDARTIWDRNQLDEHFAALEDEATADRGGWERLHR
jgi:predicted DNA-binding transcriptional regulator AlpA